ncbi:MAG: ABC transporter ATP-binding protein [Ferruginibacter sp.]
MITIENLSIAFGSNNVLHNMNAHFSKGKVYGIVGENGSGKTTLFKCIAGLQDHSGNIKSELKPLKNHIGLLQTEPYFFSKITGKEYLQLMCNARKINMEDVDSKNIFGLPLNQYAATYSTGMKKKLALMAILMQENEILILDEPFNGVDIHSNIIITEIIQRLKSINKTILISSHIFSTLNATCDEILLLGNGTFIKKVQKKDFQLLEQELINFTIGEKIEQLKLK